MVFPNSFHDCHFQPFPHWYLHAFPYHTGKNTETLPSQVQRIILTHITKYNKSYVIYLHISQNIISHMLFIIGLWIVHLGHLGANIIPEQSWIPSAEISIQLAIVQRWVCQSAEVVCLKGQSQMLNFVDCGLALLRDKVSEYSQL